MACACMHMCMCVHMPVCAHVGGQRLILGVFFYLFYYYFFLRQSLSLSLPVLDRVACLQIIQGLPVSGSPPLGFQTCTVMSNIYMSGGL